MARDPFACFTGREAAIAAFEALRKADSQHRLMMVRGMSGTGKSFLVDWLRRFRCGGTPSARITLAPAYQDTDMLRALAAQLDPAVELELERLLGELAEKERQSAPFNVRVDQRIEGKLAGRVNDATQHVAVDLGQAAAALELDRRGRRLDALRAALDRVDDRPWVVFLDETEHLANPDLRRLVLDELVPRFLVGTRHCRVCLVGQEVPRDAFSAHEYVAIDLSEFTREESAAIAMKSGVVDKGVAERLHLASGGHPLLLSMFIEDAAQAGSDGDTWSGPEEIAGEAHRTRWIYERIVKRFSDPELQEAAADLCLLEWFDLDVIRAVFAPALKEDAFLEMVNRSFIKRRGKARWRCHDMIRKHLPAHRRALNPIGSSEVCRRAAGAFRTRLANEEARTGQRWFPERIAVVTAVLHATLGYSVADATTLAQEEVARSTAFEEREFLYALSRELAGLEPETPLHALAAEIRVFLASLTAQRYDVKGSAFLESRAVFVGPTDAQLASLLLHHAARFAMAGGDLPRACDLASRSCTITDSLGGRILKARILARSGDTEGVATSFKAARRDFGDSPTLRDGEVSAARDLQDTKLAVRLATEWLADFPAAANGARMHLAYLAVQSNAVDAALDQVDAVLAQDPDHLDAMRIKADCFIYKGRIEEALQLLARIHAQRHDLLSDVYESTAAASHPQVRQRLLAKFADDPSSCSAGVMLVVADLVSIEKSYDELSPLLSRIEKQWPETRDVIAVKRAFGLLKAKQPKMVIELLAPLAKRGFYNMDLPLVLAEAYGRMGRVDAQVATLEEGMKQVPAARDLFEANLFDVTLASSGSHGARQYLARRPPGIKHGPMLLLRQADYHFAEGRVSEARDILERVIHADDSQGLPRKIVAQARTKLAALVAPEARDLARTLVNETVELFRDVPTALLEVARLVATWNDEQRLRTILKYCAGAPVSVRFEVLGLLGLCIAARQPDVDALIEETIRFPKRIENIIAIEAALVASNRIGELIDISMRIEALAPGIFAELSNLRTRALAEAVGSDESFRAALKQQPDNLMMRIGFADLLCARSSFDEALAVLDAATVTDSEQKAVLDGCRMRTLAAAGRLDKLETLVRPMIDGTVPLHAMAVAPISGLLQVKGSIDEQIQFHRRVADTFPSLRSAAKTQVAGALMSAKRAAEALEELEQIQTPTLDVLFARVEALEDLERFEDARKVVDSLPLASAAPYAQARGRFERGYLLRKLGRLDEALPELRAAREIAPDWEPPHVQLARVYDELKRPAEAYESLLDAIALQPAFAAEHESWLRDLRARAASIPQ